MGDMWVWRQTNSQLFHQNVHFVLVFSEEIALATDYGKVESRRLVDQRTHLDDLEH